MTLRGQLWVGMTAVFGLVFLAIFSENLYSMRRYVEQQLASHAQDTATSLAFPLSQALAKNDLALARTIIAVLSDRGDFQSITVYSTNGEMLMRRTMPINIDGVPSWFVSLVDFTPPIGQSLLSGGWRQLGRVAVISGPVLAYRQLWSRMLITIGWLTSLYLGVLLLVSVLLKITLSPLHAIEKAASAIANKRFDAITLRPRARELNKVVSSMNEMIRCIAGFLDAEEKRAENFRKLAYQDAVTGLENRCSFDLRLDQLLLAGDDFRQGVLFAIGLDGLKAFNIKNGYPAGNELLVALSNAFQTVFGEHTAILSRIGGASVAAILMDPPDGHMERLAKQLQTLVAQIWAQRDMALPYGVGVVLFYPGERRASLLSRLDLAIETAQHFGGDHLHLCQGSVDASKPLSAIAWRQLLLDALANSRWVLYVQAVMNLAEDRVIHTEVVSRLTVDKDNWFSASQFLPMAARHRLLVEVESALLDLTLDRLAKRQDDVALALNINLGGLPSEPNAISQLVKRLASRVDNPSLLSFEVSEFDFLSHLDVGTLFAEQMRALGCQFGIDRFGFDSRALNALRQVLPDYIKLDGSLIRGMVANESARALVYSMVQVAHSLGAMVIAQSVEDKEIIPLLREMGIDGGQGYYFGRLTLLN